MTWKTGWISRFFSTKSSSQAAGTIQFEKLSDTELVRQVFLNGDQLPLDWAREMIARGERLVPALANILLTGCNWHKDGAGWCAVTHATYLLGAIGGDMAISPLIFAMRQADYWDNDWINTEISSIFRHVGPKAIPFLKEIARNRDEDWYLRDQAMSSMAAITLGHAECEQEVFSFIAALCADSTEDTDTRLSAGNILMDFSKREHEPLLRSLIESGLAKGYFAEKDLRRAWKKRNLRPYDNDWLDFYKPEEVAKRRKRWEKERISEAKAFEEAASVAWGEEPEEDDDESGDDEDIPEQTFFPKNASMITEKISFQTSRAIKGKDFKSDEEMNAYLKSMEGRPPQTTAPENAWEVAQNLMYEAWEEEDPEKSIKAAHKALKIYPDCADAYNLLAEETAETAEEARDLYEKALRAGERQLGHDFFKENAGHFWGIVETRPYMRARADLARCLWLLDEKEDAIGHWHEMLRLNPHDNQGIRYILAACLGRLGRFDELKSLLDREEYKDDYGLEWMSMKVLSVFVGEGPSPRAHDLLQKTLERNKFLADYLSGQKAFPMKPPGHYAVGSEDEAVSCAADVLGAWRRVPKALDWLKSVLGAASMPKVGRNEPCPCGSGKKFKKCCLNSNPSPKEMLIADNGQLNNKGIG